MQSLLTQELIALGGGADVLVDGHAVGVIRPEVADQAASAAQHMKPHESDTGLPTDKSYLECGLPDFLMESIAQMQAAWDRLDRGEKDLCWDCDYCNLQTDINNAEVNQVISSEQAWYLREKYLRMERE